MSYNGPERRQHNVMVTRNTEYHFKGTLCVAVRDEATGEWIKDHSAIGHDLMGGIILLPQGNCKVSFGEAGVGQQLCFNNDVMTTPIREVSRPSRETVSGYPAAT